MLLEESKEVVRVWNFTRDDLFFPLVIDHRKCDLHRFVR
jgi:hypothetical protein